MTLYIYIGNIPKYLINTYFDDSTQAIYGYLMLPVFTISLLSQFIYQPFVKKLGELWNQKRLILLKKNVLMQSAVILLLTVFVLALGLFIGLPMLSVLYNINLIGYSLEFSLLLFGGGLNALALYLNVPITTIREQKYLPLGAAMAILLAYLLCDSLVLTRGVRGVCEIYVIVNLALVIMYTLVFLAGINHKNRGKNE
jgi:O-antigen/teichoic acid export membrane protein